MKILNCMIDDLDGIYELNKEIYGEGCYPRFVIRQFFDCFGENIKIAKEENKTIGFSINGITNITNEGWILSLGVKYKYRNYGIGTKLLERSIKDFKSKGVHFIKLTVHPENEACKLYKRFGFVQEKQFDNYYGDNQKRLLMVLSV